MASESRREDPRTAIDEILLSGGLGLAITEVESFTRPDATRVASPEMFDRLNGEKMHRGIDLSQSNDIEWLGNTMAGADVVVTSARPGAFEQLGLSPEQIFSRNPGLIWVAISGYGWLGEQADRVAFGDDAAAAGGLLRHPRSALRTKPS